MAGDAGAGALYSSLVAGEAGVLFLSQSLPAASAETLAINAKAAKSLNAFMFNV